MMSRSVVVKAVLEQSYPYFRVGPEHFGSEFSKEESLNPFAPNSPVCKVGPF